MTGQPPATEPPPAAPRTPPGPARRRPPRWVAAASGVVLAGAAAGGAVLLLAEDPGVPGAYTGTWVPADEVGTPLELVVRPGAAGETTARFRITAGAGCEWELPLENVTGDTLRYGAGADDPADERCRETAFAGLTVTSAREGSLIVGFLGEDAEPDGRFGGGLLLRPVE